jgi:hypothetical protein
MHRPDRLLLRALPAAIILGGRLDRSIAQEPLYGDEITIVVE